MERVWPILLLVASNCFMTVAWYGHLKFKAQPLWLVILASWGIACFETLGSSMLRIPRTEIHFPASGPFRNSSKALASLIFPSA